MTWLFDFIASLFARLIGDWRRDHALEAKGAADQRERDIADELERLARAAEAGDDPRLLDPGGLRDDPLNRDNR
jgi:plasmid stabilization system protein ParE